MTTHDLDHITEWSPDRWPPPDWDGLFPYLLRDGVTTLYGCPIRAYLFSDGTRLFNTEDVTDLLRDLRPLRRTK